MDLKPCVNGLETLWKMPVKIVAKGGVQGDLPYVLEKLCGFSQIKQASRTRDERFAEITQAAL